MCEELKAYVERRVKEVTDAPIESEGKGLDPFLLLLLEDHTYGLPENTTSDWWDYGNSP